MSHSDSSGPDDSRPERLRSPLKHGIKEDAKREDLEEAEFLLGRGSADDVNAKRAISQESRNSRKREFLGGMVLDIAIDLVRNAKQICTGKVDWQKPKERWTAALKFTVLLAIIACFLFTLNPWLQGVMIVAIIFNKVTLLLLDRFK